MLIYEINDKYIGRLPEKKDQSKWMSIFAMM